MTARRFLTIPPPEQLSEILTRYRSARVALVIVSGVLLAFSFPDFSLGWLAFVALTPLILAIVTASGFREAFLLATLGHAVTWLINIPWVIIVMSRFGGLAYPVGVAIYVALSITLGLFAGLFFGLIVRALHLGDRFGRWLLVPAAWVVVEYGRTRLLSGCPWNLIAASLIDLPPLVQLLRLTGPYALGYLIVITSTLLAWLMLSRADVRRKVVVSASVASLMIVWLAVGTSLLRSEQRRIESETKVKAAMLQPNISQEMRWEESTLTDLFVRMTEMTESAIESGARVVVWPESTIPLVFAGTDFYQQHVETLSRNGDVDIILGSVAEDDVDPSRVWNAAYLVSGGTTSGRYDKIRLVPFGEYVPLKRFLFFAEKLVRQVGDFQAGTNDRPLEGRFRYGPAICYEVVCPQITATQVRNGATVLVTITNDAWFGRSAAPKQHLDNARLRAIEDNRYLLRAGTTGISAIVDPTGRILEFLPIETEGIVYGGFAPRQALTPYVRFGDWFGIVAIVAVAAALVAFPIVGRGRGRLSERKARRRSGRRA